MIKEDTRAIELHAKRKAKFESKLKYECALGITVYNVGGHKNVEKMAWDDVCPN